MYYGDLIEWWSCTSGCACALKTVDMGERIMKVLDKEAKASQQAQEHLGTKG
jgi:hypothetical protein